MAIKIALPKGRLLRKTAAVLQKAGWGLDDYQSSISYYRPAAKKFPGALIRVFNEKDIPIQIAMGNYHIGICGEDWVEELLVKYPSSDVIKIKDLAYGTGALYVVAASLPQNLHHNGSPVRIVSEYPHIAESYALKNRLSRFSVFSVWGAADAYPPENAEMAVMSASSPVELAGCGMVPVSKVMNYSTYLIANRRFINDKELEEITGSILSVLPEAERIPAAEKERVRSAPPVCHTAQDIDKETVRLALPDGHQQQQTVELLTRAGIKIVNYPSEDGNRRPTMDIDGVAIKVIRPQDMPLQVANGNFDLAVTGRDWLNDHLAQFPSSPARELLDLKLRKVRLVAVVHNDIPVNDTAGLSKWLSSREQPFRVASEYVNIADKYARENHFGYYRVIPTWGATEAFLPDDADLLIENTETGRTIARHNLKIIDMLFESTACLIGNTGKIGAAKKKRIEEIINKLKAAVGGA